MRTSNVSAFNSSRFKLAAVLALIITSIALLPASGLAQGPENTVVVVNADSSDSLAIANRYVHLRNIPASNVVYLSGITHAEKYGDETGLSAHFEKQIARPVMKAIQERGLDSQISCITYSAGFPTRYNAKAQTVKFLESRKINESKLWHAPWASINSLTYFYEDAFSPKPKYFLDPYANRYAAPPTLAALKKLSGKTPSSQNFQSRTYWAKDGLPNGTPDQDQRYFLSTVLAVVGDKKRSSLDSALAQIDRSCRADGTHPKATVYFAKHGNVRSRVRTSQFEAAATELRSLGHDAIIDKLAMATDNPSVIGATLGSSIIDLKKYRSQFSPGAICDNLTSFGGFWDKPFQTQLNEYLDAGAAGACGTVCEPSAVANKFPTASLHVHYARGCTLAESFYRSVHWPFQLLIVGDPLCCPYGNFPQFKINGLQDGETVSEDFVLQVETLPESPSISHFELFYDGVFLNKIDNTKQIAVATDSVTDGYHELRIVGVSDAPIANRYSERVGFVLQRKGHSIDLNITTPERGLGQILRGRAVSTTGNKIQILQNWRAIATVESNREFVLKTSELGLGKTRLQAVAMLPNGGSIKSQPVSISLVSHGTVQEQERLKPPSKADLKQAISSIRELLKDHYKDSTPEGRTKLLQLLQKTADDSVSDSVNHYALLSECIYAASVFGDVDAGWAACDQIDKAYKIEELPHLDFIKSIKAKLNESSASILYGRGVEFSEQLIKDNRFAEATNIAKTLGTSLKGHLPLASPKIESLANRSKLLARKFKSIQKSLDVLAKNPSDPKANEKVGEFYCLQKLDFEQGLPHLVKSTNSPIQKLAVKELAVRKNKKTNDVQKTELADQWWELGSDKKYAAYRTLAVAHYANVVPKLEGLEKVKVQQRIEIFRPLGSTDINNTFIQLSSSPWTVEWDNGYTWSLRIIKLEKTNEPRLEFSSGGKLSTRKFSDDGFGGIEYSAIDKSVRYQFKFSDGKLLCVQTYAKSGKQVKGVGIRSKTEPKNKTPN